MGVQGVLIVAAFTPLFAMAGCHLTSPAHLSHCRQIVDSYIRPGTLEQRMQEFTTHELDTQYAIYICGDQYIHPGIIGLSEPFASEGEVAARYLHEKLRHTAHDRTIVSILQVYAFMVIKDTYDVRGDTPLMWLIEQKAQIPLRSGWRGSAQYLLDVIHGRQPQPLRP